MNSGVETRKSPTGDLFAGSAIGAGLVWILCTAFGVSVPDATYNFLAGVGFVLVYDAIHRHFFKEPQS